MQVVFGILLLFLVIGLCTRRFTAWTRLLLFSGIAGLILLTMFT